uniref:Uncharacterized protein n=1 Tax=Knipowitschia caucasica TaxID=637954 RepID=A0AAV2JE53_KNICA
MLCPERSVASVRPSPQTAPPAGQLQPTANKVTNSYFDWHAPIRHVARTQALDMTGNIGAGRRRHRCDTNFLPEPECTLLVEGTAPGPLGAVIIGERSARSSAPSAPGDGSMRYEHAPLSTGPLPASDMRARICSEERPAQHKLHPHPKPPPNCTSAKEHSNTAPNSEAQYSSNQPKDISFQTLGWP